MTEMIERVAVAIETELKKTAISNGNVIMLSRGQKLEGAARAAIEAMREPTEAMVLAGAKVGGRIIATAAWDVMIAEAMK